MDYIGYNIAEVYKCDTCGSVHEINVSDHVLDQWVDRSRLPHLDVIDVWNESVEIFGHKFDAQEVRYHHPSRMVLLMKEALIITAIYVPLARFRCKRACIQALVRVEASSSDIAQLLNELGITKSGFKEIVEHMNRSDSGDGPGSRRNQHSQSETKAEVQ